MAATAGGWRGFTSTEPCPYCGKSDWCRSSADGNAVMCYRVDTGDGQEREDNAGRTFWLYLPNGKAHRPVAVPTEAEPDRADPDTLHRAYAALLKALSLSAEHRDALLGRGLPEEAIRRGHYRTLPIRGRAELAGKLTEAFGADVCATVPGWYVKQDGGREYATIAGAAGLVVPCRDAEGRIVALKVRADDPGPDRPRYSYVSSARHGGPGPGSPVHLPVNRGADGSAEVRLTEGELKADVATALSGLLTVSVAGVSTWKPALPVLHQLGAETVRLAFDADFATNPHVARALSRCGEALQADGFRALLETWPAEQGKGIDDLLAAGGVPDTEEFEPMPEEGQVGTPAEPDASALELVTELVDTVTAAEPEARPQLVTAALASGIADALAELLETNPTGAEVARQTLRLAMSDATGGKDCVDGLFTAAKQQRRAKQQAERPERQRSTSAPRLPTPQGSQRHCPPGQFDETDIGNGDRLIYLFGDRLRWCPDWKTWLAWDGTRWAVDPGGEVARRYAKRTAVSLLAEAAAPGNELKCDDLVKWYGVASAKPRVDATLWNAQAEVAITVQSTALDADPDLLNCRNGTIDLRTGELLPHDQANLITRRVEAEYHPEADLADTPEADLWRQFLVDATGGDDDLTAFLQRASGYSLTGNPNEEVIFFAYGPAQTGKSTYLDTFRSVLADYADSVDFAALLRKREGSDARPEIAKLQGKRLAVAVEASGKRSFEAELIKWIAGGEMISARALHANPVSWLPAFTLWLGANDRPMVNHDDTAVWRRLRVIPLTHQVSEEAVKAFQARHGGKKLKDLLRERCRNEVLSWMVRGCLAWRQQGLGTCAAVAGATGEYREAMDPLGDWLEDRCKVDPSRDDWFVPTQDLFRSYRDWCDRSGEKETLTQKDLKRELEAKGLTSCRGRVGRRQLRGYAGIGFTAQGELQFDDEEVGPQAEREAWAEDEEEDDDPFARP